MCVLYFFVASSSSSSTNSQSQFGSVNLTACWLSIFVLVVALLLSQMAQTAFSFYISSFNFFHTHTHSYIFDIFFRIFSSIYTNNQLLLLLLLLLSTLLTVPFRSFALFRFGTASSGFNVCVCVVHLSAIFFFIRLHFK